MALDSWLPVGHSLPDGARVRLAIHDGIDWQVFEAKGGGLALVVKESLINRWIDSRLIEPGVFSAFTFGGEKMFELSCGASQTLSPILDCKSPTSKNEALA